MPQITVTIVCNRSSCINHEKNDCPNEVNPPCFHEGYSSRIVICAAGHAHLIDPPNGAEPCDHFIESPMRKKP